MLNTLLNTDCEGKAWHNRYRYIIYVQNKKEGVQEIKRRKAESKSSWKKGMDRQIWEKRIKGGRKEWNRRKGKGLCN